MASTDRLIEVFNEAKARPAGAERDLFLTEACRADPQLKEQVLCLLQAHEDAGDFLKNTQAIAPVTVLTEKPGDRIGRYKLLQKIGEGGCGVVYMADQEEPVRRRVAFKVIKLGMDTKQVVARFEAEGQALAMMDHPNIAKVFDAGATSTGRPYFVMELVRGIRITDYCDQNNLPTEARLKLFTQVCHAIQHAHQKGIIHRDIKPSNILVTVNDGLPVPKVIDFGIAKAIEHRLTDKTVFTAFEQFIGTPAYMSPEQAEMTSLDIDTRADIYSLGVLLYELLSGNTPFDATQLLASGVAEIRRIIREQEPPKPSTRLNTLSDADLRTVAQHRHTDSPKLLHLIRGDLDWIVMKCLEKDRTRRYETANGLAADIQRHLTNEPVVARPPSNLYRFQKLVRRNKLAFTAASAVTAALVTGLGISTWMFFKENQARHRAVTAEREQIRLREQAESEELAARQRAYASDMNLVQRALGLSNLGRALELLNRQRPKPGQRDLRGWEWRYLWGQCRGDQLLTFARMPAEINSLALSADGGWLASATRGGAGMLVWDLRTRREVANLPDVGQSPRVALSSTEPLLAIASSYGEPENLTFTLRLWNIENRRYTADLPLSGRCAGLAFSEDGRKLVVVTEGGQDQITVWEMPAGNKLASHTVRDNPWVMYGTAFAATRKLNLAAYHSAGGIHVFDLNTGSRLRTIQTEAGINALAFSDDGSILAAGSFDTAMICLYDVVSHKEIGRLPGHQAAVNALVFWPDGKTLASASSDQTIRLWDVGRMAPLTVLRGHLWEVWSVALLPDHRTLISGCKDGSVNFWDTGAIKPHPGYTVLPVGQPWRLAEDGESVVSVDRSGVVSRSEVTDSGKQRELLKLNGTPAETIFSQDGRLLATRLEQRRDVQIWDLERGSMLGRIPAPDGDWCVPMSFLARGGKLLVYTPQDQRVHEWNLTAWEEVRSWPGPPNTIECTASLSRDERFFLLAQREGEFCRIYDLINGGQSRAVSDIRRIESGAFAPDGATFAICSALGFVSLRETATLKEIARFSGFTRAVLSVAFSPDGKRLVGAGADVEAVKMWDLESGQELLTLEGAGPHFRKSAFSADGSVIGWLNQRGQLHLWRAPSWAEIEAAEKSHVESGAH